MSTETKSVCDACGFKASIDQSQQAWLQLRPAYRHPARASAVVEPLPLLRTEVDLCPRCRDALLVGYPALRHLTNGP